MFAHLLMGENLAALAWVVSRLGGGNLPKSRVQRAVYLLQALGFPTGYEFSMYIRGPYSPELASDYQKLVEGGLVRECAKYAEVEEERWGPIVDKLAVEDVLVLEVAATLYDLLDAGWPLEEAEERVMELKPYATERLLEAGLRLLKELGLVGEKSSLNGVQ